MDPRAPPALPTPDSIDRSFFGMMRMRNSSCKSPRCEAEELWEPIELAQSRIARPHPSCPDCEGEVRADTFM
jgi:hypothetical protein